MPERNRKEYTFPKGFWATQNKYLEGTLIDGNDVFVRAGGLIESSKGFGANGSSGGVAVLLNVSNGHGGLSISGNIVQAFAAGVYFFAGSGTAFVNAVSKGAAGSSVTIYTGSSTVNAGLVAPGAVVIADSGAAGHNNGSYAVALTAVRSITGGESTIGPPSNALAVKGHGVKITARGSLDAGADKVGVYATRRGQSQTGPFYHLYDVTVAALDAGIAAGGYVIQVPGDPTAGWIDGQLGDLAPLDFNPPPACTFVIVMNSVAVAVGAYGGAGLHASYANKPEAYPARFAVFLPGGGVVTACKGTGFEGSVLVATASSLNLVTATPNSISPILIRQIWPMTGVQSGNQFCVTEDMIYAFLGKRGPVRSSISAFSGGGSDLREDASDFAEPVLKAFADNGFTESNTVVAYDPVNDSIWFMKGNIGFPYCRATGLWSPKQTLPVTITTAATVNGKMLISDSGGNLYTPEAGSGTSWSWVSHFTGSAYPATLIGFRAVCTAAGIRFDIMKNPSNPTIAAGGSNLTSGVDHGVFSILNIPELKAWAIKASGTDAGGVAVLECATEHIQHLTTSG